MGNDFAFINWILNLLIRLNPIVPDSTSKEHRRTTLVTILLQ